MSQRTYHILLVEDSPSDVRLFKEAIRAWTSPVCLHIARDAPEALDFLKRSGKPRLDLIITNINLPKMSGLELLRLLRELPELSSVPKMVLTSSANPVDREKALEYGARSYQTKPTDFEQYCRTVADIETCCTS